MNFVIMSDNPEKTSYYARLVSMYIDLGTEIVLNVFIKLTPSKDPVAFLQSIEVVRKLDELKRRKILNKEEYDIAKAACPSQFDISLLVTLVINLFSEQQLPPPLKGWLHPPKNKDKSIAADLLRLRQIRNLIVGHHPKAQLDFVRFDDEWNNVKEILLRLHKYIAPDEEEHIKLEKRINEYRDQKLDIDVERKFEEKLVAWYKETSKVQKEIDELLKKLEGFDCYFKNKSDRYDRYIRLLVEGGEFVLASYLDVLTNHQQSTLKKIIKANEAVLRENVKDPSHIELLYPSTAIRLDRDLSISSWGIGLLATVILHSFDNVDKVVRKEIKAIQVAQENYIEIAIKALDTDSFDDCSSDLKTSIKMISKFLGEEEESRCNQIIDECKKKSRTNDASQTCEERLESCGIKSFSDLYTETLGKTKDLLKRMKADGIGFGSERVLELKMITVGTTKEKTMLAETILVEVWQGAIECSGSRTDFQQIQAEVNRILKEIKKNKTITRIAVTQKCILLSVTSSSPSDMLVLIEYFESSLFHDAVNSISRELGYYFDTIFGFRSSLTINSLHELQGEPTELPKTLTDDTTKGLRLIIGVSSPTEVTKLQTLFKSEKISKSKSTLAELVSKQTDNRITFDLVLDMKEFSEVFPEDDRENHSLDSSSDDSDQMQDKTFQKEQGKVATSETEDFPLKEKATHIAERIEKDPRNIYTRKEQVAPSVKGITKERPGMTKTTRIFSGKRRVKDFGSPAEINYDIEECHLSGLLLDYSGPNQRRIYGNEDMEQSSFALSQLQVLCDFLEFNGSRYNNVFSIGCGASQGNGIFDIIETIQHIQTEELATDETIENIFQILDQNGARMTRKWADKHFVRQNVYEYEAQVLLFNLRSTPGFATKFVQTCLPAVCHDWGMFAFILQQVFALFVSLFRQATVPEVREIVNQSMSELNESLLMSVKEKSIYRVDDAARAMFGKDKLETQSKAQKLLNTFEKFIFGSAPLYSALREASVLFLKSLKTYPKHQRVLFVLSEGHPTDEGDLDSIKKDLMTANVTVVCFSISRSSRVEHRKGFDKHGENWNEGEKFLFAISSTLPRDVLPRVLLIKQGWQIGITNNNTKLFVNVHHPDDLMDICRSTRNALSCRDSLYMVDSFEPVDEFVNQKEIDIQNHEQLGGTCFANACSIVLHLAMQRIPKPGKRYPLFAEILDEILSQSEIESDNTLAALESICNQYQLHCQVVNSSGALNSVAAKRPVIAKFKLSEEEWRTFGKFYGKNPFGILKESDLKLGAGNENTMLKGHAVVLTSFNSECLRLMNCWGDQWADTGFFRVENSDVLQLEFIDVFWIDIDSSAGEIYYNRQHALERDAKIRRLFQELLESCFTCPLCEATSKVTEFKGTLSRYLCPKCSKEFSTVKKHNKMLALNAYLSSLCRKTTRISVSS